MFYRISGRVVDELVMSRLLTKFSSDMTSLVSLTSTSDHLDNEPIVMSATGKRQRVMMHLHQSIQPLVTHR